MRGLTNEERQALEPGDLELSDEVCERLEARGLLVESDCEDCGAVRGDCDCPRQYVEATALGQLALRLDAAARAVTGVPTA
jgi:hypothetical protein